MTRPVSSTLAPPLAAFAGLAQHPVVGGDRSEVGALVQQDRPDFVRGQVSETLAVQRVQDRLSLGAGQRSGLDPLAMRDRGLLRRRRAGPVAPVPGGLRHPGGTAGRPGADPRRQQGDRLVGQDFGPCSVSALSEIVSKSACSFDWTSTTKRDVASSFSSLALSRSIWAIRVPRIGRRAPARLLQPGQRPGIAGPPPLADEAGVQALPAQDRAFLPVGRRLVSGQDL